MAKTKPKNLIPWGEMRPGNDVVVEGRRLTLRLVDPVIDPRGDVYIDTLPREWYVTFTDGSAALVSGSAEAA